MGKKILDQVRDLYIRELIGGEVRVLEHSDPAFVGLLGTVLDETMNTFLIRFGEVTRRVPKKGAKFEYMVKETSDGVWVELDGDMLIYRPEDRTKKLERKKINMKNGS
ncbi:MAG: ribonuclease P protein subunit [Candidatus Thermoplasmatota archaeon]|nr:ribonuclease P protein subunit [Candidatus Thermoplasmatota archaeon]